jgi:hypothetical protein
LDLSKALIMDTPLLP